MNRNERQRFRTFFAPHSLGMQLLSRSLIILAVLLVLIGFFQYMFMKEVLFRNKAFSLQSQLMSIPHDAWKKIGTGAEDAHLHPPFFFIPESNLAFVDVNGHYTVLSSGPDGVDPPKLETQEYLDALMKKPGPNYKVVQDTAGREQLVVLHPILTGPGEFLGVAQISTQTSPLKELLIHQLLTFLILSVLAMLVGGFAFLPVLRRTLVPLFNMMETAEHIDAGNLTRRFPTQQGQLEIDRLSESFNRMLDRLEASFEAEKETQEQMRRFIADASHELRTPLTSIRGFLEILLRGAVRQPDQLQKVLKSMHSESERLSKLVQDLLLLAKLDRKPHIELSEGCLDTVIREMESQLRILAGRRKISLELEANLKCKFDADKMKQVILNLFHNAVQHTDPETGQIQISLRGTGNGVVLSVKDNGPGISEKHLPYVFERFYRSDSSRTRKYGGAGLGLSISKSIVDVHGGTIEVESKEGEGCTFRVWLPGPS
jgi:two-component system, OmpR family, sensor kinase